MCRVPANRALIVLDARFARRGGLDVTPGALALGFVAEQTGQEWALDAVSCLVG